MEYILYEQNGEVGKITINREKAFSHIRSQLKSHLFREMFLENPSPSGVLYHQTPPLHTNTHTHRGIPSVHHLVYIFHCTHNCV